MNDLPIIIILFPLISALLSLPLSKINKHLGRNVVAISIFAAFVCSVKLLAEVIHDGAIRYTFGGYKAPYGIEFYIDSIGAIIVLIILLLGFITVLYTMNFEVTNERKVIGGAYALIGLLIVGMCGMTLTGDVFNLYVFLEITSLSGYCLIALGGSRGIVASFRYLLVGTVAATMYLLGVGILYASTGTLNMTDMRSILDSQDYTVQMTVSMCLFIGAFDIKMPMFPFHGWQPSAYAHAEPGSRPLIVGIMGKIPALAMFRYLYIIYGTDFKYFNLFLTIIGVLSCIGIIYGSIRAMAQEDIRKIFAYSSIAQIGYITLGFSIGNSYALAGAFLHLIGHVFMKSGLFFSSAAIRYRFGNFELSSFGRIYKKMPITSALIVLASLSMIGIPPTVGFFSKWYIALGAVQNHQFVYLAVLVLSSLLNAVYFFKLIEKIFINKPTELNDRREGEVRELPISMLIAIVTCFVAIIAIGIFNVSVIDVIMMTVKGVGI